MKNPVFIRVVFALLVWQLSAMAEDKTPAKAADGAIHVKADAAAKLVAEKKVMVLDVRTPAEYQEQHIAGARNIDFNGGDFEAQLQALDKKQPWLVHCRSGGRSGKALATLKKIGFETIYHLDGGILDWEDAGKPLEK